jgi:hypothetical protein
MISVPRKLGEGQFKQFGLTGNKVRESAIPATGHNPPVGVTFQFLLLVGVVIELSGLYSASKLMTSLPRPGHNRP